MSNSKAQAILILILGILGAANGQKSSSSHVGYIVMSDSLKYMQGEVLFNRARQKSVSFRRFENEAFIKLSPAEVNEFGFQGKTYVSENIDNEIVFLEKLVSSKSSLLRLKSDKGQSLFLSSDQFDLIKLKTDSYKSILKENFEGEERVDEFVENTKLTAKSLSRMFLGISTKANYFTQPRIGAQLGFANRSLVFFSNSERIEFDPDSNISFGAFADLPIGVLTPFSARIEALFTESSYAEYGGNSEAEIDYLIKFRTTTFPILLKYRFLQKRAIHFFIEGGLSYGLVSETFDGKRIVFQRNPDRTSSTELNVASNLYGGLLGIGGEYLLSFRRVIAIEARYGISNSLDDVKMHSNTFEVFTSINF